MTAEPRCILSTSADVTALFTRNLVLQKAGFDVISCAPEAAVENLRKRLDSIAGAVLGHSIPLEIRVALARQMRELSPNLAIVVMYLPHDRFDASCCDAVVETLAGPAALLRGLLRALKKQGIGLVPVSPATLVSEGN